MADTKVKVNRAPVLTLWAAVVAERLGFSPDEALTLGRGVAGLNAQSKGQRLGIFHPSEEAASEVRKRKHGEEFPVELLGRAVPAVNTPDGLRATTKGTPINPDSVSRYLDTKFKDALPEIRKAMEELADSLPKQELNKRGFALYEEFRPEIPEGVKGWGALGELDAKTIRSLKK